MAYWVVRSRSQRCQVLADLAVQPGWWRTFMQPDVMAMADAVLPPFSDDLELMETCDVRALAREPAALRLERACAGVRPWPYNMASRAWWRARYGPPG